MAGLVPFTFIIILALVLAIITARRTWKYIANLFNISINYIPIFGWRYLASIWLIISIALYEPPQLKGMIKFLVINLPNLTPSAIIPVTIPSFGLSSIVNPSPTEINTLAPTPIPNLDPVRFVHDYYTDINDGHYNIAWSKLSARFQREKHQMDFSSFANFWTTEVASVNVVSVYIQALQPQSASVQIGLQVKQTDQCVRSEIHIFGLITDNTEISWLIDTQEIVASKLQCPNAG